MARLVWRLRGTNKSNSLVVSDGFSGQLLERDDAIEYTFLALARQSVKLANDCAKHDADRKLSLNEATATVTAQAAKIAAYALLTGETLRRLNESELALLDTAMRAKVARPAADRPGISKSPARAADGASLASVFMRLSAPPARAARA